MINIEITQTQRDDWQLSIDTLARIASCGAGLWRVNQVDMLELVVGCQLSKQTREGFSSKCKVFENANWQAVINSQSIAAVCWPGGTLYGYLYLCSPELTVDNQRLLTTFKKSFERDLADSYRVFRLKQSETRKLDAVKAPVSLQQFIDCIKEHVWMKDASGRYVLVNHSVELAWSLSREHILNRTDHELFEPRLANHFVTTDEEAIVKGIEISAGQCEGLDIGNVESWLETTKLPIFETNGELAGVIGVSRNISSHKAAQDQLELASRVFENAVEGVIITDIEGTIINAHGAFQEITGYSKDELLGQNPRLLNSGRHSKAFFSKMWSDLLTEGKWHGEIWNRRKNGAIFPQILNISSVYDDDKKIRFFVAVFNDISVQKQNEAELEEVAFHDPLTKLPNRMGLSTRLAQELKQARQTHTRLGLVYIDVDLFKQINESYGYPVGDKVLLELSQRFLRELDNSATIARLGSDEFAVTLSNINNSDMMLLSVNKLRQVFDKPFTLGEHGQARLTASMGVAICPDDGQTPSSLMVNAEIAMHRAKHDGRNNYAFYTESLTQESAAKLKLQSALHDALSINAFHLVYQPKISFKTGKPVAFEALLRWNDPVLGNISPAVFIPLAEKIGLIQDIGNWVLKTACKQAQSWREQGVHFGRVAVNVASQQLQRRSFVAEVADILEQTGLPANCLELEVTESGMMSDQLLVSQYLAKLGNMGIELSIDDFGTGYSSLSYLKKLPIHKLKIDQSFVAGLPLDTHNTAIAKAIIAMGHALNLRVVAEGVETQAQVDFLKGCGCDEVQGYFYSRPQLPENLSEFLLQH
ncbi:putative bifunctional diguanylate cyclase/phosphodiesterase [Shewanella fidelis]|uniref:cyclic-guanylate-specific phosphodiesterase n=1 Tax=Shewanella fidelis TaxID=173509 RepID=A0AAW8NS81_9GAMM|nr:EAL domain-containing protein [Shewanella fidelis]MDR8525071.1 EAL domain-containing protein [Shewanella fidelis]MDW4811142.1 EAL domain-containing protein [Shewanella fidelis]MDW4815079.1 EAL domain-containing protein [Shewanella fidelis]MDW4819169.1 EAL domain-containing protein [Shewanella fidelis]MDW4823153.1 EAL domain-containing protein [Shewanella fidelis]